MQSIYEVIISHAEFAFMTLLFALIIIGAISALIIYLIYRAFDELLMPYLQSRAVYKQAVRELKTVEIQSKIKKIKNKY